VAETLGGLLSAIQRITLENTIDGGLTWSTLWTGAEVHGYLNQRLSRFLVETEVVQKVSVLAIGPSEQTFDLPADLVVLKRVAASSDGVTYKVVVFSDRWATDAATLTLDEDRPAVCIPEPLPPLRLKVLPTPVGSMNYQIIYVYEPVSPYTTASSRLTTLFIPDMFTPYLLFGILADMFKKEGEANDPDRAKYFEDRWKEGLELGKLILR
jgi:hypothetical protein